MRWLMVGFAVSFAALDVVAEPIETQILPALLQPVSNNAVTLVSTDDGDYLYSFLGLGSGKTWQDISSGAAVLNPGAKAWIELEPVPGSAGRLAASAVSAGAGYQIHAVGTGHTLARCAGVRAFRWY